MGNPVQKGSGPAAVIEDERRTNVTVALDAKWEGAASRMIREPEDLPDCRAFFPVGAGKGGGS